jgi:fusion and transport protein UGO1
MIRRIRHTPTEGLPALWKSQIITTLHSISSNLLQPHVHSLLLTFSPDAPSYDIPLTALPNPTIALGLQVASHLLTHLVLSPMEVIRTRLIAMPMSHASTPSSVSMFRRMVDEEGGFSGMYFNSNLLIPSIFEHTVRPLLTLSIPLLLERTLGYSPEMSPITYSLCDLSLGLGSLLILLPIETVRKRLQIQARGNGKRGKTIVRTRDRDYVGVVEAIWRIVTEETGVRRKRVMDEKDEGGHFSGIRQLYRGVSSPSTLVEALLISSSEWQLLLTLPSSVSDSSRQVWEVGALNHSGRRSRHIHVHNVQYIPSLSASVYLPSPRSCILPSTSGQTIARSSASCLSSSLRFSSTKKVAF